MSKQELDARWKDDGGLFLELPVHQSTEKAGAAAQ